MSAENVRVANSLLETALEVKRWHWTLRGNDAAYLHKQLDELFEDLIEYSDRLFEDAFAHDDEIEFDAYISSNDLVSSTDQVVRDAIAILQEIIADAADIDSRRGTNNILDDIAEGLTNWVYLLSLYQTPA